ncbi:GNAT family acetyltransferase [Enterococcus faecium EnGen0254]|nr:GNAT family acetyltransferase [Enterococcus faecium EnGen0254]
MKKIVGADEWIRAASCFLRYQVFVLEQGIPAELEFDGKDIPQQTYYLFLDQKRPVATLRYEKKTPTCFKPERFCVAKEYRGKGLGGQLLEAAEKRAVSEGCQTSYVVAEMTAVDFYEKQGYHTCTEPFIEDEVLCIGMKKSLAQKQEIVTRLLSQPLVFYLCEFFLFLRAVRLCCLRSILRSFLFFSAIAQSIFFL